MQVQHTVTRRRLFSMCVSAGTGLLVAGCAAGVPPSPTAAPAAPAPAPPTSAPASAPPQPTSAPVAAAATQPAPAPPPTTAPVTATRDHLKVGVGTTVANAGVFVGNDRGYFRDLNLDIEYVPFPGGGADMAGPLAANQIDIAGSDPSSAFLNAIARGINVKFVADSGHTDATHSPAALMVRKALIDSGAITDFPDLRGRKVSGVIKGSLVDSWVHRFLDKGGLKESDVDIQYLGFPDNIPALASGAIDAALLVEPLVTAAVTQNIAVRWKGVGETFGPLQNTVIMYAQNLAENRPEPAKRFMVGYLRSVREYMAAMQNGTDKAAIVQILVNNTSLKDPALYDKIGLAAIDPNGQMVVSNMKDLQQWFVDNGYVPKPVDLETVIDRTYIDYAVGQLGLA